MFKTISAEIKKILSKPGIYVLAILLAIILILGVFIYEPKVTDSTTITLDGNSYVEKYACFMGDYSTNRTYGIKLELDTEVESAIKSIKNYQITTSTDTINQKEHINNLIKKFEEQYYDYRACTYRDETENSISTIRNSLVNSIDNLYDALEDAYSKASTGSLVILTTESNYNCFVQNYKDVKAYFNVKIEKNAIADYCAEYEIKYKPDLYNCLNSFIYPTLTDNFIATYTQSYEGTKLNTLNNRLAEILDQIEENYLKAKASESENQTLASEMDKLGNLYVNTSRTYANLIKYELICHAFNCVSTSQQLKMQFLSNHSAFNSKSLLIRYDYLFENNKSEHDYAHPLTIGVTSNSEINAYDYAYFVLKLFSFVIIVFAIMTACNSIAGEIKEGSMRYLAIRPVSRTHLYLGKLIAIIILSIILILFSFIIALCVGGAVYGFSTMDILTIFNGKTTIIMHPLVMLLIYLLSVTLELIIYTSIALLISSLIKSDLLAVTLLLMIYLINIMLPMFISSPNSWLTYYPFSHISLYSLFGSSVYALSGDFFNMLLGAKVYTSTNFILTISIIVLIIAIINTLAIKLFKKKEF